MDDASDTLTAIRRILILALPGILILAIFAGHRITKRAFEPIAEITSVANSIQHGQDLSKRLPQTNTPISPAVFSGAYYRRSSPSVQSILSIASYSASDRYGLMPNAFPPLIYSLMYISLAS